MGLWERVEKIIGGRDGSACEKGIDITELKISMNGAQTASFWRLLQCFIFMLKLLLWGCVTN